MSEIEEIEIEKVRSTDNYHSIYHNSTQVGYIDIYDDLFYINMVDYTPINLSYTKAIKLVKNLSKFNAIIFIKNTFGLPLLESKLIYENIYFVVIEMHNKLECNIPDDAFIYG